jgi:hypothetical protein
MIFSEPDTSLKGIVVFVLELADRWASKAGVIGKSKFPQVGIIS